MMGTLPSSISLYDDLPFLVQSEEGLPPLILSLWEPSRPRSVLMGAFPPSFSPGSLPPHSFLMGTFPPPFVQSAWKPSLPRPVRHRSLPLLVQSEREPSLPRSVWHGILPSLVPVIFTPVGNLSTLGNKCNCFHKQ